MAKAKGGDGDVNKMGMVREALEALGYDAKPAKIDEYIKEKHNYEVPKAIISSYKSLLKNKKGKGGGGGAKRGPKPRAAGGGAGIQLADLATVRGLVSRLGAAQVKQLVDVLG
ncbi:MAG TPA: hypothetical protein VMZ71_08470 [Gemmataceae bacterium]|nr:hypothetical protein [Gemmataceae bacterium]